MVEELSFEEWVRKRPGMYIGAKGGKGIIYMILHLVKELIAKFGHVHLLFEISIKGDGCFNITLQSQADLSSFLPQIISGSYLQDFLFSKVLIALSSRIEILTPQGQVQFCDSKLQSNVSKPGASLQNEITFNFELDKAILVTTDVEYQTLSEELYLLAVLNRQTEILIKDESRKYLSQNYYHFPEGVFYLFKRTKEDILGEVIFEITYDDNLGDNDLQLGIAYRSDWYPPPTCLSFGKDEMLGEEPVIAGVLDGLFNGCKKYVRKENLSTFKIEKKKFLNGLIIVGAVRNANIRFMGVPDEKPAIELINRAITKLIGGLVYNYLAADKERANKFLWRFDQTQLTHAMFLPGKNKG